MICHNSKLLNINQITTKNYNENEKVTNNDAHCDINYRSIATINSAIKNTCKDSHNANHNP